MAGVQLGESQLADFFRHIASLFGDVHFSIQNEGLIPSKGKNLLSIIFAKDGNHNKVDFSDKRMYI